MSQGLQYRTGEQLAETEPQQVTLRLEGEHGEDVSEQQPQRRGNQNPGKERRPARKGDRARWNKAKSRLMQWRTRGAADSSAARNVVNNGRRRELKHVRAGHLAENAEREQGRDERVEQQADVKGQRPDRWEVASEGAVGCKREHQIVREHLRRCEAQRADMLRVKR